MSSIKPKREKQKQRLKIEAIKNMFTSMVITISAVVVMTIAIPKSMQATIEKIETYEHEIIYHVSFLGDEDETVSYSNYIVLENQFEYYEREISGIEEMGIFEGLVSDTVYTMKVVSDKGFGKEVLAKEVVRTKPRVGGDILGIIASSDAYYQVNYTGTVFLQNEPETYTNVSLQVQILPYGESEPYLLEAIPITLRLQTFDFMLPVQYATITITLTGLNPQMEEVVLDQEIVTTDIMFQAYLYLEQVTLHEISLGVFPEYSPFEDVSYSLSIYEDEHLIESKEVLFDEEMMHHEMNLTKFANLRSNTLYKVTLLATYQNPHTLKMETKMITEIEVMTVSSLVSEVTLSENGDMIDVFIRVQDVNHFYQKGFYQVYEIYADMSYVMETVYFDFTREGLQKWTEFSVSKPLSNQYILIGIQNQDLSYYYLILEQINWME